MRGVAGTIRSIGVIFVGVVLGMGTALASGPVLEDASRLPGSQSRFRVEVTDYDIGRDGRSIRAVDLTVHGDLLPTTSALRYRLGDAGGWSEKCPLARIEGDHVATASDCRAPEGATAASTTSITVVVGD